MSDIMKIHQEAMKLAESAIQAKKCDRLDHALALNEEAFEKELFVAMKAQNESEPTRSILLRSAATLALRCNKSEQAIKLVHLALSGDPTSDIKFELNELLQEATFEEHLALNKIELSQEEIQLSLAGSLVAPGFIEANCFFERFIALKKLIMRTFARLSQLPFGENSPFPADFAYIYNLFVSPARAQSYAVTVRIGTPIGITTQPLLPYGNIVRTSFVVNEVAECLGYFAQEDEFSLAEQIKDPAYYRNFVGLAKQLAPDETKINTVGITIFRNGKEDKIALRKSRSNINVASDLEMVGKVKNQPKKRIKKIVELIGILRLADSTSKNNVIRILDEMNGETIKVLVPEGMMDDIVRPMWNTRVKVAGQVTSSGIKLKTIDPA